MRFGFGRSAEEAADETENEQEPDEFGDEIADYREDGPFDIDEVELGDADRIDLGALIITPFPGLTLQLRAEKESGRVQAAIGVWEKSALELTLYAATATDSDAVQERLDQLAESAAEAGGDITWDEGPFGPELCTVVPLDTPKAKKKKLVQAARVWAVKGPRWVLQAALVGELATTPDDPKVAVFVEFFRNLVVRRGDEPRAPGDLIAMSLPQGGSDGEA
jgi:hypothetical protein